MMQEPEGPGERDSLSALVPVGKLRCREERHLSRVACEARQSGPRCGPLDSPAVLRQGLGILSSWRPPPSGPNFHSDGSPSLEDPSSQVRGQGRGHLGKEQALGHQTEGELVTGIVQEVLQPQEGHATQLPPVPPAQPELQLPGLRWGGQVEEWGMACVPTWLAFCPMPEVTPACPTAHPLQGDNKGLVPGLLGHRPPASLAHDTIVHLQHGQHLTCRGRTGSSGHARSGGGLLSPAPCGPLLTGQVSSTTLRLGPAPEPALGGAPGQRGRWGPSRDSCQQLLTAQEADLQCPCGESAGNTVKCHSPSATPRSPQDGRTQILPTLSGG